MSEPTVKDEPAASKLPAKKESDAPEEKRKEKGLREQMYECFLAVQRLAVWAPYSWIAHIAHCFARSLRRTILANGSMTATPTSRSSSM